MTTKQRKLASQRMKAYWAKRRTTSTKPAGDPLTSIVRQLQQRRDTIQQAIAAIEKLAA